MEPSLLGGCSTARIRLSPTDAAKHVNDKKRQNHAKPRDPITSITLSKDDWGLQSPPHPRYLGSITILRR